MLIVREESKITGYDYHLRKKFTTPRLGLRVYEPRQLSPSMFSTCSTGAKWGYEHLAKIDIFQEKSFKRVLKSEVKLLDFREKKVAKSVKQALQEVDYQMRNFDNLEQG
jgi:hypothetical protein